MPSLARHVRDARAAVEKLLEELGVRAFVYTLEQKGGGWVLSIECATDGAWQKVSLHVDPVELSASLQDAALRGKLRAAWAPHLSACAR